MVWHEIARTEATPGNSKASNYIRTRMDCEHFEQMMVEYDDAPLPVVAYEHLSACDTCLCLMLDIETIKDLSHIETARPPCGQNNT